MADERNARTTPKPDEVKVPAWLREVLKTRGDTDEILSFVQTDITNEGELRDMYLACTEKRLYFLVAKQTERMYFSASGMPKTKPAAADIGEVYS